MKSGFAPQSLPYSAGQLSPNEMNIELEKVSFEQLAAEPYAMSPKVQKITNRDLRGQGAIGRRRRDPQSEARKRQKRFESWFEKQ